MSRQLAIWRMLRVHVVIVPFFFGIAHAQSNLVLFISAAGDSIGAGQTYYTTNPANIVISGDAAAVSVQAFGFTATFSGPGGGLLVPGTYANAQYPPNGNVPGLSIFGNGRSCTNACGNFVVREIATNTTGQVQNLWVTFLQHCECDTTPPLTGEIRYNSQIVTGGPSPRTLLVPQDFPTIQSALNNVSSRAVDTVLVGPGVYQESVQIGTNNAHVVSAAGPEATFITAPGAPAVSIGASFKSGAIDALLSGFTLTNSSSGVSVSGGFSPVIVSNVILNCGTGAYIATTGIGNPASTILRSNLISGSSGWAVQIMFTEQPVVEGNRLVDNGGGITLWSPGTPQIRNNIIMSNRSDGVNMANTYAVDIIQNLIIGNTGFGLSLSKPDGGPRGPWAGNNTILDNTAGGIATSQFAVDAVVFNNIVVGDPPLVGSSGIFLCNNFYPAPGGILAGPVTNLIGTAGNISVNPYLVCQPGQDYHLLAGSPCIDAGTNASELVQIILPKDFDGGTRIQAGNTNLSPKVDMGAFEFALVNPMPCDFLFCPTNLVVIAPSNSTSATVAYRPAYATPGAALSYAPPSGSVFPAGDSAVSVTALSGSNLLDCMFTISVLVSNDFSRALNTNLTWNASGDAPWFVQNAVTRDGLAAARSGPITNSQSSVLQTEIAGPATLKFWWKVSSEANHDYVSVSVNGLQAASLSGEIDWRLQTIYLGAGLQTIRWTYSKDASGNAGQDAAWLDLVTATPGATAPIVLSQPTDIAVAPGQSAAFTTAVAGTPPLAFQWRFNGLSLPDSTASTLSITNVRAPNVGAYSLSVTNVAGQTNTVDATLELASVVAWGDNEFGQTNVPLGLTNVIAIAGGYNHSMVLQAGGKMLVWGANNAGQTNVPATLSNAVAVSSRSGDFCMALKPNGTVTVWGDNSYQQRLVPVGTSNVVAIAAGGGHCLVLKANGTVTSWGYLKTVPAGLSNVVAIAAADFGNLALNSDGTFASWGQPTPPSGLSNVVAVTAGQSHSVVLKQDGSVVAWGDNSRGQTNVPPDATNVVAIVAGDTHNCALKADGTVIAWGQYRIGSGYVPATAILGLSNVVAIAAGSDHVVALLGDQPPVLRESAVNPQRTGNVFSVSVPTQSGRTYRMEFQDSWDQTPWNRLPLVGGDGTSKLFTDTNAIPSARFYRVRRW